MSKLSEGVFYNDEEIQEIDEHVESLSSRIKKLEKENEELKEIIKAFMVESGISEFNVIR